MCLHLVRLDHGHVIANQVARRLVSSPQRAGDQAQFIERPVASAVDNDRVALSTQWAIANLASGASVRGMARLSYMSQRTFSRRFRETTGLTARDWLTQQRVTAAASLLQESSLRVDAIAAHVGLSTPALRSRFHAFMGVPPTEYRSRFRADPTTFPISHEA